MGAGKTLYEIFSQEFDREAMAHVNRQVNRIEIVGKPPRILVTFVPCRHTEEIDVEPQCNLAALIGKELTCGMCSEQLGRAGKLQ